MFAQTTNTAPLHTRSLTRTALSPLNMARLLAARRPHYHWLRGWEELIIWRNQISAQISLRTRLDPQTHRQCQCQCQFRTELTWFWLKLERLDGFVRHSRCRLILGTKLELVSRFFAPLRLLPWSLVLLAPGRYATIIQARWWYFSRPSTPGSGTR